MKRWLRLQVGVIAGYAMSTIASLALLFLSKDRLDFAFGVLMLLGFGFCLVAEIVRYRSYSKRCS